MTEGSILGNTESKDRQGTNDVPELLLLVEISISIGMFISGEMYGQLLAGMIDSFGPRRKIIDVDFDSLRLVIRADEEKIVDKVWSVASSPSEK